MCVLCACMRACLWVRMCVCVHEFVLLVHTFVCVRVGVRVSCICFKTLGCDLAPRTKIVFVRWVLDVSFSLLVGPLPQVVRKPAGRFSQCWYLSFEQQACIHLHSVFCPRLGCGHGQAGPLIPMGIRGDHGLGGHARDCNIAGPNCCYAHVFLQIPA